MAREMEEVRSLVGTGTDHHQYRPVPRGPEVFGWNTCRTFLRNEETCLAFFSITASGPNSKVGKEPAVGGEGALGTRPG